MLILKKSKGNNNRDNASRKGFPVVLLDWIETLSREHSVQVWTWLEDRPISGALLMQAELQKRF